ncbi:MAG TPA: HAD-IIIC family phosphatase [Bryobacteraceae bacterium]
MKLSEALKIQQSAPEAATRFDVLLACGFTPLHLRTFLLAELQLAVPGRHVRVETGLFEDLIGTLDAAGKREWHGLAIALEWADLDPRLGFRSAGPWGPGATADIVSNARAMLDRIAAALVSIPPGLAAAISMPILPLPPIFHFSELQASEPEIEIRRSVAEFESQLIERSNIRLLNASWLAEQSPPGRRYDLQSDLLSGLPYTLNHTSVLGRALARLLVPSVPKKGLITDLDDTLWNGILGDAGPEGIDWDLASRQQLHGLYQKLLSTFSEEGILIGVASKNDPALVQKAFQRGDILLRPERIFPIEASWNAKSASVSEILTAWNVSADSVVFVDDSPMELAEVAMVHPEIECIRFPKDDYSGALEMFRRLRETFARDRIYEEDGLRLESVRNSRAAVHALSHAPAEAAEAFLQRMEAVVEFQFGEADARCLDLINKTNQFNLNGSRLTEAEWAKRLEMPDSVLMSVTYRDKFGPLGKIAVLQGCRRAGVLHIACWVMSCRAFARRIEHQCLKTLFQREGVREISFDFAATPRNGPLQDFFAAILGSRPEGPVILSREDFEKKCPPLYHRGAVALSAMAAPSG